MTKLEQIGTTYIEYAKVRKIIDDLKYDRTVEFRQCDNNCYTKLKLNVVTNVCNDCKRSWNYHLQIIKHGAIAGGLKNKLNNLIKGL